jgi:hypothetical protein
MLGRQRPAQINRPPRQVGQTLVAIRRPFVGA